MDDPSVPLLVEESSLRLGPLGLRQFRVFFVGTILANLAQWMQQFAMGWLVVQLAVGEGTPERASLYLGLIGLARLVPTIIVGFVAGVAADRYNRAGLLVAMQMSLAVVVGATGYLTLIGRIDIVLAMISTALLGVAFPFDAPARLSLVQTIVGPGQAFSAIGMIRVARQAASIIGPLIGGIVILWFGVGGVMLVNSALFLAAGFGLGRLASVPGVPVEEGFSAVKSFREGLGYVAGAPRLRGLMAVNVVINAFAWSFTQLLPAVAQETLHVGALELSWLVSAAGVGAVLGALVVLALGQGRRFGYTMFVAVFALGVFLVLFGLQRLVMPALVLAALIGAMGMVFLAGSGNVIQMSAPNELRGRVVGLHSMLGNSAVQLGILILGTVGSFIGISNALSLAGIAVLTTACVMLRVPAIREASRAVVAASS